MKKNECILKIVCNKGNLIPINKKHRKQKKMYRNNDSKVHIE